MRTPRLVSGSRTRTIWVVEMALVKLSLVENSEGRIFSCVVATFLSADRSVLRLSSDDVGVVVADGYDFEEALQGLRAQLEKRGYLLLCNRYRRDAFVTSLSRQMSGGLSCYLVEPWADLDHDYDVEMNIAELDAGASDASAVRAAEVKDDAKPTVRPFGSVYDLSASLVAPNTTYLDEAASASNGVRTECSACGG